MKTFMILLSFVVTSQMAHADNMIQTKLNSICWAMDLNNWDFASCKRSESIFEAISNDKVSLQGACGPGEFMNEFCGAHQWKLDPIVIFYPANLKQYDFPALTVAVKLYCQETKSLLMKAQNDRVSFLVQCKPLSNGDGQYELKVKAIFN